MAYKLKTRDEFQTYLTDVEVLPSYDELCIDKFDSTSLFDLYKLFTELKNDKQISPKMQEKLKQTLERNFPQEISSSLSFPIEEKVSIKKLEEHIKNIFLEYYERSKTENLSPKEQSEFNKLQIIVSKKFPEEFLKLIKENINPKEFELQTQLIKENFSKIVDEFNLHVEKTQNNEDIVTGIYITNRSQYPDLKSHDPAREKSLESAQNNMEKEIRNSLSSVIPSQFDKGITFADLSNQLNFSKISDDFYGSTIVLDNTVDTLRIDTSTDEGQQLMNYKKQRQENYEYYHDLMNFLDNPYSFLDFTQEQYLQIKIELLHKLQNATYQECSEEYKGTLQKKQHKKEPGTSFSKLLESSLEEYNSCYATNNFKQDLSDREHTKYQEELSSLTSELANRIDDKYQFQLLLMSVPSLFMDKNFSKENILRDHLKVSIHSTKIRKKRNGYCAIYVILSTPDGRKIEVQLQTSFRYQQSKIGSSDHSLMENKQLDISQFFELKNFSPDDPNYKRIFDATIKTLDTTTIAEKNRLLSSPIENLSSDEKRLRRDIEFAQKNLQIKETFKDEYTLTDGSKRIEEYTLEDYLPIFASYYSPKLIAVSSPHSRVNEKTAFVNIKTLDDNFRERLLKTDATTCLANMLLKRLQKISKKDKYFHIRHSYTNSAADIKERIEEEESEER